MRLPRLLGNQVLSHLEAEVGPPVRLRMAVHGRVEQCARIGLLIADDHPTNRKVVEIILAGAGMQITTVDNGLEAVRAHSLGAYDVVLMDMQMPVMDGLTATAEIRAAEARVGAPRVPIVMLTANALPEHIRAGRRAGADGHLTKPITPASLFAAINDALEAAEPQAATFAA